MLGSGENGQLALPSVTLTVHITAKVTLAGIRPLGARGEVEQPAQLAAGASCAAVAAPARSGGMRPLRMPK